VRSRKAFGKYSKLIENLCFLARHKTYGQTFGCPVGGTLSFWGLGSSPIFSTTKTRELIINFFCCGYNTSSILASRETTHPALGVEMLVVQIRWKGLRHAIVLGQVRCLFPMLHRHQKSSDELLFCVGVRGHFGSFRFVFDVIRDQDDTLRIPRCV
jgi:hypothetical protein